MKGSRNFIESLSRGLSILFVLSESSSPLNLTELSQKLHLSKSTLQRQIFTLHQLGYLERDEGTKRYRLGRKVFTFGFNVVRSMDLRKIAHPFLEAASKEIGETVNLAILDGVEIVYVERIKTEQILNINLQVGSRLPTYCTSMGKAILAFMQKGRVKEIMKEVNLVPLTPNTISRKSDLKKELQKIRENGFAINNEELVIGLRSVAAPVRNYRGEVIGAVNIAVPSSRVSLKVLEFEMAKKVMETADKISQTLGYRTQSI
jgi:IclR family pca regulon transcriptional regulator